MDRDDPLKGLGERGPNGTEPGLECAMSDSKLATKFPTRLPVGGAGLKDLSGVAGRMPAPILDGGVSGDVGTPYKLRAAAEINDVGR